MVTINDIIYNNGYTVFFEEKFNKEFKAHIACIQFDTDGRLLSNNPQIVLKEDFHISYPGIFFLDGCYYMIPETAATNQLYLYRCISFPNQWERKKILMDGVKIYDATVYKQDDY